MSGFAFNKQAYNTAAEISANSQREQQNAKLADQQKKAYDTFQATGINKAIIAAAQQLDPQTAAGISKTVEDLGNTSPESSMTILKGVQDRINMQAQLDRTQQMLTTLQNQGNGGSQTSSGTPQVSGSIDQTGGINGAPDTSGNSGGIMVPKMTIGMPGGGSMDVVNQGVANKILAQQKSIENQATLKLDAQKSFQTAAPVIASAINSLDDVATASQKLPAFDSTALGQLGAKGSMALKAFSQDPATAKYLATLGRVGPSLTRLNIGNSNRINVQELNATKLALGETTAPLATKMDLIDSFRDSVVKPLQVEARAAGYTPEKLKETYPDAYQALYMRRVQDPKSGQVGFVPIDQYKKALDKGYKRV